MRGISHRDGGLDEYVYRCTCGEWLYVGQLCRTFQNERGDSNELGINRTAR